MANKPLSVSQEAYRRDYLHAMEAPEVFRSIDLIDLYEGLSRHPHLNNTITVDSATHKDMVRAKDIGLFQRVRITELSRAFGIKDTDGIKKYVSEKLEQDPSRPILLADFQAYLNHSQARLQREYPHPNGQRATYPFLAMNGVVIPEHFRQQGEIPVQLLLNYFEAMRDDVHASGSLPRNGKAGITNKRYHSFASIEEQADTEKFVSTPEALRAVRPYLSARNLKEYREAGKIEWKHKGPMILYSLSDLQKLVSDQRVSAVDNIADRATEQELARILPLTDLRRWQKRGRISATILLKRAAIRHLPFARIQDVISKMEHIGIKVETPGPDALFKLADRYDIVTDPNVRAQRELGNNMEYYNRQMRECVELPREQAVGIGRTMVRARDAFVYTLVRQPRAAKNLLAAFDAYLHSHYANATLLFKDKATARRQKSEWPKTHSNLKKIITATLAAEKHVGGEASAKRAKNYRAMQDTLESKFKDSGIHVTALTQLGAYQLDDPSLFGQETYDRIRSFHEEYVDNKQHLARSIAKLVIYWSKKHASRFGSYKSQDYLDRLVDIIGFGNIGLMQGVERWDPEKGFALTTYVSWWINQAIQRFWKPTIEVRNPEYLSQELRKYKRARESLLQQHFREPTLDELAEAMGSTSDEVVKLRSLNKKVTSYDHSFSDDDEHTLKEIIGAYDPSIVDAVPDNFVRIVKGQLKPTEWHALEGWAMRGLTLDALGEESGVTRERIRQRKAKALAILSKSHSHETIRGFLK